MSGAERYRPRADVRFRRIEDEAVVLRQQAGEVLVLNAIGARVLELLAAGESLDATAGRLVEEFEVELVEAEADVRSFAAALGTAGVLEPAPPSPGGERS